MTKTENLLAAIRVLSRYINNPTEANMVACDKPIWACLCDSNPHFSDGDEDAPYCGICRRNYKGECMYSDPMYKSKDAMLPFRNGCSRALLRWSVDRLLLLLECDLGRFDLVFNIPNTWTLAELLAFEAKEELPGKPFPNN